MTEAGMRIAIYGNGGCGHDIAPWARALGHDVVFASDTPGDGAVMLDDLDVDGVLVAVADPVVRRRMAERVDERGLPFTSLFAPTHVQRGGSIIGEGAAFHDYTIVTANSRIGRHCIVNLFSYIAHDCVVGDFVTLSPHVCINGNVHIGDGVFIGTGAIIANGEPGKPLIIGDGAFIGMGALVSKDVPAGARVLTRERANTGWTPILQRAGSDPRSRQPDPSQGWSE